MLHVEANGARIPALGFGTWQLRGDDARRMVADALAQGYRHIDTARMYENEREVGEAIRSSHVPREDIFLTTKVWYTDLRADALARAAEDSLEKLGLPHVDLFLVHWPNADVPLDETMRALAGVKSRGMARHIGVSNFPAKLVEAAVRHCPEPIAVNQVEYHPYLDQTALLNTLRRHSIGLTAYCPLARGAVVNDPVVTEIAERHGKTQGQVALRWLVQQGGVLAIPRSSRSERAAENFDILDFELSSDEIGRLHALARADGRMVDPEWAPQWD